MWNDCRSPDLVKKHSPEKKKKKKKTTGALRHTMTSKASAAKRESAFSSLFQNPHSLVPSLRLRQKEAVR